MRARAGGESASPAPPGARASVLRGGLQRDTASATPFRRDAPSGVGRRSGAAALRRLAAWIPALACVLAAAWLGVSVLRGGDILIMTTPSMGTVAPVGSLVVTHPLGATPLRVGTIVAFRVPQTGVVYMHRIAVLLPGGRFRTRGDLDSADDGWVLTRTALVGTPTVIFPWLGWVLMGAPWAIGSLAAGMLIGYGLPRSARPAVRSAAIGAALALPIYKVRPFVRVTIATSARAGQRVVVSLVDTGVLPLQVRLRSSTLLLRPGHLGTISARIAPKGTSVLSAHPWLPAWGWGLVAAVVLLPLLVGVGGLRDRRDPSGAPARSLLPV